MAARTPIGMLDGANVSKDMGAVLGAFALNVTSVPGVNRENGKNWALSPIAGLWGRAAIDSYPRRPSCSASKHSRQSG